MQLNKEQIQVVSDWLLNNSSDGYLPEQFKEAFAVPENPYKADKDKWFNKLKSWNVLNQQDLIKKINIKIIKADYVKKLIEAWTGYVKFSALEQGYNESKYQKRIKSEKKLECEQCKGNNISVITVDRHEYYVCGDCGLSFTHFD